MVKNKLSSEEYILDKINKGEWPSNFKLPTEGAIMKKLNVSKMTIRKTMDRLKEKEVIYSIRGSGSYVSPFHQNSKFKSLRKQLKANKVSYLPSTSKMPLILSCWF